MDVMAWCWECLNWAPPAKHTFSPPTGNQRTRSGSFTGKYCPSCSPNPRLWFPWRIRHLTGTITVRVRKRSAFFVSIMGQEEVSPQLMQNHHYLSKGYLGKACSPLWWHQATEWTGWTDSPEVQSFSMLLWTAWPASSGQKSFQCRLCPDQHPQSLEECLH